MVRGLRKFCQFESRAHDAGQRQSPLFKNLKSKICRIIHLHNLSDQCAKAASQGSNCAHQDAGSAAAAAGSPHVAKWTAPESQWAQFATMKTNGPMPLFWGSAAVVESMAYGNNNPVAASMIANSASGWAAPYMLPLGAHLGYHGQWQSPWLRHLKYLLKY